MNLREIANADLTSIIEDTNECGTNFTLVAPSGAKINIIGIIGDIGFLYTLEDGAVQDRTIDASYRTATLLKETKLVPAKGWKVIATTLEGTSYTLSVVRVEPDKTIGMTKLVLAAEKQ